MAKSGKPRQAEKLLRQVVAGWESAQPPDDVMHTRALRDLGAVLNTLFRGFESEVMHRTALQVRLAAMRYHYSKSQPLNSCTTTTIQTMPCWRSPYLSRRAVALFGCSHQAFRGDPINTAWAFMSFKRCVGYVQELKEGKVADTTAIAICKQGLAEAILAERPRWRRQQVAAEAEQLLREALALQQTPMEPSCIADIHVIPATTPIKCCSLVSSFAQWSGSLLKPERGTCAAVPL